MNIGRFAVRNGVFLNIIMVTVLILGALTLKRLPKETQSDISFSWGWVAIAYPGVSAEDVEKTITIKVEDQLANLDRLNRLTSVSREGLSFVQAEFEADISDAEFRRVFQDLRAEVDKVELPTDALDPHINEFTTADFMPIISLNIAGDMDPVELNRIVRNIRDDLVNISDISQVQIVGGQDQEIWVEVDARAEALGISLGEVSDAIMRRHSAIPAGTVTTPDRRYVVRTTGEVSNQSELGEIIVRSRPGEGVVRVRDIAYVSDGLAHSDYDVRVNGENAISLFISKKSKGSSIELVEAVKERVAGYEEEYRGRLTFSFSGDTSIFIEDTLNVLGKNARGGIVLLIFVLFLFLGVRTALIAALGVPLTFAITFIFMEWYGESLNANSLFALVLVLGMIVDHAIVIVENIYRHRQAGLDKHEASERGTNEVVKPVIAATLTTIAAFLPLMLLPGIMGKFFRIIPVVVSLALVASTIEALFFIPLHASEWGSRVREDHRFFRWIQQRFKKILSSLFRYRYLTIFATLVFTALVFLLAGQRVNLSLFEGEALSQFYINIELPDGASRSRTDEVVRRFEERILPLVQSDPDIVSVNSTVAFLQTQTEWKTFDNVGQIIVYLRETSEGRSVPVREHMERVRELCAYIGGAERISFEMLEGGPPVDKPVSFRLLGRNLQEMGEVSQRLRAVLEGYDDLYNVADNYQQSSPELVVRVDEERAAELGLSVAQVGLYLRQAIDGIKSVTYFDDDQDIDVIVRFDRARALSLEDLTSLQIPTPDGRMVPFSSVASMTPELGVSAITRYNRFRAVTVTADAYSLESVPSINSAVEEYFNSELRSIYPEVRLDMAGQFEEFNKVIEDVTRLFLIGIFLLYIILGAQFKSYFQPVIMMMTIPFALVGVLIFLIVSSTPFSIVVMYALVALVGISVNDSIVLISFINERRAAGGELFQSVVEGAVTRLRPIILTSATTIGGLVPLAYNFGGSSETWSPMAKTIIYGLLFSTLGTLVVIPCMYGVINDITALLSSVLKRVRRLS